MTQLTASNLPTELIHAIADAGRRDYVSAADFLTRFQQINRHWYYAMKSYPTYSVCRLRDADFPIPQAAFDYLSARQDVALQSLVVQICTVSKYATFRRLLNYHYPITLRAKEVSIELGEENGDFGRDESVNTIRLPETLKTQWLTVTAHRRGLFYLDLDSFSTYLRNHLTRLKMVGVTFWGNMAFDALQELDYCSSIEEDHNRLTTFLDSHPRLKVLSVTQSRSLVGLYRALSDRLPRLALGQRDAIQQLAINGVQMDFTNSRFGALKKLSITQVHEPLTSWEGIGDTLETLEVDGCNRVFDDERISSREQIIRAEERFRLNVLGYADNQGDDNADKYDDDDADDRGTDLLDVFAMKRFYKLKTLHIDGWYSDEFETAFEAGSYDRAFPLLENVYLGINLTDRAWSRFIDNHKHLNSYIMNRSITSDLPLEVILNIADAAVNDGRLRKETEREYILKLMKVNRHWRDALRSHPIYTTTSMTIEGNKLEHLREWLATRQGLIIYSLECIVSDRAAYDALCTLLDNHFPHTTFNILNIDIQFDSKSTLHLPKSLKVHDLTLYRGSAPDNNKDMVVDSGSFSKYLREHLQSLGTYAFTLSEGLHFKSLKKLTMHRSFIRHRNPKDIRTRTYDNAYDDLLSLLALNPHIKELSLGLSCWEYIWHYAVGERLPRLVLGQLDNLEKLHLYSLQVDFGKTKLPNLKDLHIEQVWEPLVKWDGIGEQLESVVLQDCTVLFNERLEFCVEQWSFMLNHNPLLCHLAMQNRDKPATADTSPDDHDLLDVKKLGKFRHLRTLAIDKWFSPAFKQKFDAGIYDKAMPLLEEFHTHDPISVKAFRRFNANHKHLTHYCDSFNEDIRYGGVSSLIEEYFPHLVLHEGASHLSGRAMFMPAF